MAWSSILGHEAVAERVREQAARGRLSHAYLFIGPDGVGKELFARELAKAVQCEAGTGEACDACRPCLKVEHGNHPDVTTLRRIDRPAEGERRTRILIDQVREEIQDVIAFKPFEGRYKVFLVADADQMTEEAQNCLLKTLEEPPPRSLLVLVAPRLERFVDTVVSRCQVVRFRPLVPELVERILTGRHGVAAEAARALAHLSGGSPGRALHYLRSGAYETVVWLLGELGRLAPGGEFVLAGELLDRAKEGGDRLEDTREQLRSVLELLTLAWRDCLLAGLGAPADARAWGDPGPAVSAVLEPVPAARARRLVEVSVDARERVDRNANIKLVVEKLLLDTCSLLHGREATSVR